MGTVGICGVFGQQIVSTPVPDWALLLTAHAISLWTVVSWTQELQKIYVQMTSDI